MQHIKKMLSKHLQGSKIGQQVQISLVMQEFEALLRKKFGPNISKSIRPLYIKKGVLTLVCLHSASAQEIWLQQQQLLEEINHRFNTPVLREIKVII